jgi:hypothetical protein
MNINGSLNGITINFCFMLASLYRLKHLKSKHHKYFPECYRSSLHVGVGWQAEGDFNRSLTVHI